MLIRVGYELEFHVPARVPMVLMLYTHPSRAETLRSVDWIRTEPELPVEIYKDSFGNFCGRIVAPPGRLRLLNTTLVEDSGQPDPVVPDAIQHPIEELPADVMMYLLGSRYCEVDKLTQAAWYHFGHTPTGWARVQAVCDWVHQNVKFGYHFANQLNTAWDIYQQRGGVCRDLNHLALTFCRCLNIPARYATGYLGDIGVPISPSPMDFSGWFEAYLGGQWYTFDARHNKPRIGRVVMARGRDAVDVALTTSFGPTSLQKFVVYTDEVPGTWAEGSNGAFASTDTSRNVSLAEGGVLMPGVAWNH